MSTSHPFGNLRIGKSLALGLINFSCKLRVTIQHLNIPVYMIYNPHHHCYLQSLSSLSFTIFIITILIITIIYNPHHHYYLQSLSSLLFTILIITIKAVRRLRTSILLETIIFRHSGLLMMIETWNPLEQHTARRQDQPDHVHRPGCDWMMILR